MLKASNPLQSLIDKIDKYSEKLGNYEAELCDKLTIWYDEDLSDTYFSVILKDILIIIKRMVPVYVRVRYVENDEFDDDIIPVCPSPYCHQTALSNFKFARELIRTELYAKCQECGSIIMACDGSLFTCPYKCREDSLNIISKEVIEYKEYLLIYYCSVTRTSFALIKHSEKRCGRDIWFSECVFIETINGRNKRVQINSHIYSGVCPIGMKPKKIVSITTSKGVYKLV